MHTSDPSVNTRYKVIVVMMTMILITSTLLLSGIFFIKPVNAQGGMGDDSASGELTTEMRNWEMINHNNLGWSFNPQNVINRDNVNELGLKWIFPYPKSPSIPGAGTYEGSGAPVIVVDGIAYAATNHRGLIALNANDGRVLWNKHVEYDNNQLVKDYPHVMGLLPHTHAVNYYADQGFIIPSFQSCQVDGHDSLLGDLALQVLELCGTQREARAWGNLGFYASIGTHPPAIFEDIMIVPVMGSSGKGGRSFIAGYDISDPENPSRLWQTFVVPEALGDKDWALHNCDKGWFFSFPEWEASGRMAVPCSEIPIDVLQHDWRKKPNLPLHSASTVATVWGHFPVDPETGIVYIGLGESGPYPDASKRPGPNLYGSGIIALDSKTGETIWWFQAVPHDMWDMDCAWGGMLGDIDGRKVLYKGCKNGFLYALDAATGEPVWVFQPPDLWIPEGSKGLDPKLKSDMTKDWPGEEGSTEFLGINYAGALEADLAYDGEKVFLATMNMPVIITRPELMEFGNPLIMRPSGNPINSTIYALDAKTGEIVWDFFLDGVGYRGGLTVSGGVLYIPSGDGFLYMVNSDNGELIGTKAFGTGLWTQITIGADASDNMKVFIQTGGQTITSWGPAGIPGAMLVFGLPDSDTPSGVDAISSDQSVAASPDSPSVPQSTTQATGDVMVVVNPFSYILAGFGLIALIAGSVLFFRSNRD